MDLLMFTNDVSSEILVIYGLIGLVIALIIIVLYLDKKEKKRVNLVQTQELRLMDLRRANDEYIEEFKKIEEITRDKSRVVEKIQEIKEETKEIKTENLNNNINQFSKNTLEAIDLRIDEDTYVEDDLEKTQAQLHLEALTNELKKAQEREIDKITRFEEEQEENAIISYKELLKVCDKLYDNNEKVQYMDEGDEPITISQLRSKFSSNDQVEVL